MYFSRVERCLSDHGWMVKSCKLQSTIKRDCKQFTTSGNMSFSSNSSHIFHVVSNTSQSRICHEQENVLLSNAAVLICKYRLCRDQSRQSLISLYPGLTIKYFNIKSSFHDQFAKKKKKCTWMLPIYILYLQNYKSSSLRRSAATNLVMPVSFLRTCLTKESRATFLKQYLQSTTNAIQQLFQN